MASAGLALSSVLNEPSLSLDHIKSEIFPCVNESILIYVALPGCMIPMHVSELDSIKSVKLRIQSCRGFVVRNQKLVCQGRELARSDSLVRDYGVADGNVLHLVLRLSDIQIIKVETVLGKEFILSIERGRNICYVKQQIAKREKEFDDIEEQEVVCDGEQLEDQRLVDDICKNNNAVLHLFVRKTAKIRGRPIQKDFELSIVSPESDSRINYDVHGKNIRKYEVSEENSRRSYGDIIPGKPPGRDFLLEPVVHPNVQLPLFVVDMIKSTFNGLESGKCPVRSPEGTGGAYFMQDASGQKFVAVFKPVDEEPLAFNNPQGLPLSTSGEGLKKGTRVGEGAFREVAAYILDHPKDGDNSLFGAERGFAGVPPTVMVKCWHREFNNSDRVKVKIGSLQMFMENSGSCEDMGPGAFPVKEVHKMSVLDLRLANADRHAGNILVSKDVDGKIQLIPIDHGYCLPDTFEDCTFDWLYWPQARQPYSPEIVAYIRSLDAEEDIALLKNHGWDVPFECARTLRISTMLLQKGVDRGLTPFEIGNIMCRENLRKESVLEEIVLEAQDSVLPGTSEDVFLETLSSIMDRRLDEISGLQP